MLGTLHTTNAAKTIDRIIDQFPADRQSQVRVMLSESLRGVIAQTLCKKVGGGRVAAREILLSIPALLIAIVYPFFKRFFALPQAFLGIAFSFGIPMAFAAAFDRAGFAAFDVHMSDIIGGRATLDAYSGIVAGGGFSYGDVLGAGEEAHHRQEGDGAEDRRSGF